MENKKTEVPMVYRSIAQSGGITITAETRGAVLRAQAEADVLEHLVPKNMHQHLKPFVTLPICTAEAWERGYINFCPRCGRKLEDADDENYYRGTCWECKAEITVEITVYDEGADDDGQGDN